MRFELQLRDDYTESFSALQRAENSSTVFVRRRASLGARGFSALQRAENSSTFFPKQRDFEDFYVSVLFSEPKIPQPPTLAPASIHISDRDDHASSFLSLPGASP